MKKSVVVYLIKDNKVLMGMKKMGYAKGKWNGFGGKCEAGEDIYQTAVREVEEESGLIINKNSLNYRGKILYHESGGDWEVNIFTTNEWVGEPTESEEMKPEWFLISNLPVEQMWENDQLWLPKIFNTDKFIEGTIWLDEKEKVVKSELREKNKRYP